MVKTRSQTATNNSVGMSGMDRHSDGESEDSLPDVLTRDQINDFDVFDFESSLVFFRFDCVVVSRMSCNNEVSPFLNVSRGT